MTYEDFMEAAKYLRKYAAAVESHLYMNMATSKARYEIDEAERLAEELEEFASDRDTDFPIEEMM
jgi:hypothetical protein